VHIRLTNAGDESAHNVRVEAEIGDLVRRCDAASRLPAGDTLRQTLSLGSPPVPAGVYTAVVRVRYTDAKGHAYTALDHIPLVTAEPVPFDDPVVARLSSARIEDSEYVTLELNAPADAALDAGIRLVLPDEISCPSAMTNARVPAGGRQVMRFQLRNVTATPGSRYPIVAVIDYLHNAQHRSHTASATIDIAGTEPSGLAWLGVIVPLCVAFALAELLMRNMSRRGKPLSGRLRRAGLTADRAFPFVLLAGLLGFTLYHMSPATWFMDTLTTGGDTPAHNYLASHLRQQLLARGRIVSWADGWWCGFPMFQFYFCLPYLLVALLSSVMPFNIAFKLVSVSGILALPPCAYASARIAGLRRPIPGLLAVAMIPVLFVTSETHTMWGVSIYSTLAGMIANSVSFPIMLLFVACAYRDADDGRFRLRTVFLLAALIASHFFTTVIAGFCVALVPLLRPRAGFRKALLTLAAEAGLGFLLMAWWIVPLVAKHDFAVDFGTNWQVSLTASLPAFTIWLAPFALLAVVVAVAGRHRFALVTAWMLLISVLLFFFGYRLSPVFVNVRLWPFVLYALVALEAIGIGLVMSRWRAYHIPMLALMVASFAFGVGKPNTVRDWATWNYTGLENMPGWPVFEKLILPLDGTAGRLANDLHDDNQPAFGTTRIFECVPHLIDKPVLEGGIVNSAVGALFSYYVQGETSRSSAGLPAIVQPATFDITNATKHLELFNVKHFLARWGTTQHALAGSDQWRLAGATGGWELYELLSHNGRYVVIPEKDPVAVRIGTGKKAWKHAALQWLYAIEAVNQPYVLLGPHEAADGRFATVLTEKQFRERLSSGLPERPTDKPRGEASPIV
jgi:hypothetical protein